MNANAAACQKQFVSSAVSKEQLLVEPLNHSTFARRHSFEMEMRASKGRSL